MGTGSAAHAYDRENHAKARRLSPFFHKLSAKVRNFREGKGDIRRRRGDHFMAMVRASGCSTFSMTWVSIISRHT